MRTSPAATLLACLATALPACVAAASAIEPDAPGSTNLVWLLDHSTTTATSAASPALWALNATITADSITFHDGNSSASHSLVAQTSSSPTHVTLPPFDPSHVAALQHWASSSPALTNGNRPDAPPSPWSVRLERAEARSLKLKGKGLPKLTDQISGWTLVAVSSDNGAIGEVPLLEAIAAASEPSSLQQRVAFRFVVQPSNHPLDFTLGNVDTEAWSSTATEQKGEASLMTGWWSMLAGVTGSASVGKGEDARGASAVRTFIRDSEGSYQPIEMEQAKQHVPWKWAPRLDRVRPWPSSADRKGVSDSLQRGCHRFNKALKQASPFKGSTRPFLGGFRKTLPRPHLNASALATKVHDTKVAKTLGRPVEAASGLFGILIRGLAKQWREADGPKQTFMAVFAILQVVWLACTIKGWLDRLFGRKVEYRNRRTKTLARKAAFAAVGGCGAGAKRAGTWSSGKPRLPPRPTPGHPLMPLGNTTQRGAASETKPLSHKRSNGFSPTNELETTESGEIVLPSWTENGPSPLMVIVEEPELEQTEQEELDRRIYTHSKKRSDYDRMAGEWDDHALEDEDPAACLEQGWSSSNLPAAGADKWTARLSMQSEGGSLRYRERSANASLPLFDDVVSPVTTASTSTSPPTAYAEELRDAELESAWSRCDRAELERGWRDSCMEEGVFDSRQ